MSNQSDHLVVRALLTLNTIATLDEIVDQFTQRYDFNPEQRNRLSEVVEQTLKEAVRFGFIRMENGAYCLLKSAFSAQREQAVQTPIIPSMETQPSTEKRRVSSVTKYVSKLVNWCRIS
ncbi:uncharacterized protein LOC108155432 [Drosophila miranda]|uniref:uncharacterized protein LOC108155432 n=1 Tax=Drosophila miranda TaxID=7229 RepID=UPI0007E6476D|nr:uncharacterized protein LOC108155432 [Drosophila miranda]